MELRDNNTRKLTSGLRRPFGVAGNAPLSFSPEFQDLHFHCESAAAAECWTAGCSDLSTLLLEEKSLLFFVVSVDVQLRRLQSASFRCKSYIWFSSRSHLLRETLTHILSLEESQPLDAFRVSGLGDRLI